MKLWYSLLLFAVGLSAGEKETVAFFTKQGGRLKLDADGHVERLTIYGKLDVTVAQFQDIGSIQSLQQLAVNVPPAGDGEWNFLRKLPHLKTLTIWHGHQFSSLSDFSDLPLESLTLGGCMGLRNLNKDNVARQRDAVLSLKGLPHLKKLSLYHSPLTPDDIHLAHIVKEFPKLEDLRVDFAAPRGTEMSITPAGLKKLHALPLTVLTIENAQTFTADHMTAIATIPSLKQLNIDAQKKPFPNALAAAARNTRAGLKVEVKLPRKK